MSRGHTVDILRFEVNKATLQSSNIIAKSVIILFEKKNTFQQEKKIKKSKILKIDYATRYCSAQN